MDRIKEISRKQRIQLEILRHQQLSCHKVVLWFLLWLTSRSTEIMDPLSKTQQTKTLHRRRATWTQEEETAQRDLLLFVQFITRAPLNQIKIPAKGSNLLSFKYTVKNHIVIILLLSVKLEYEKSITAAKLTQKYYHEIVHHKEGVGELVPASDPLYKKTKILEYIRETASSVELLN